MSPKYDAAYFNRSSEKNDSEWSRRLLTIELVFIECVRNRIPDFCDLSLVSPEASLLSDILGLALFEDNSSCARILPFPLKICL